jgi:hypothetical protein
MDNEQKKLNYAALRTKLAAIRTLLLFIVSIKAFILLSATKHINVGIFAAVILILICGYHYYCIINALNNGKIIKQSPMLDYYPLALIPVLFVLTYLNLKYKLNIKG